MAEAAQTRTPETQLFHDVFNASPIGIVVENLEGQPLFVNPAFCAFLGFSEKELRNKHCVDFSPPEDAEKDWALFQQLRAGSIDNYQLDKRYFRSGGSLVWGRLSISLLNSRPSPLVLAMVEDITDKKKAEEARFRHAAVIESSEDAIASGTLDGIIVSWNAGAQHIYGYTEAEAVGKPITMLLPPELLDEENKIFETLRAGGRIEHFETVRVTKTGKRVNVSLTISPIKDSSGRTVGISGIARDITERKRAEEVLADASRKLIEMQEKERTRIARDLHDDIQQRIALVAVDIQQLKQNPPDVSVELSRRLSAIWESLMEASIGVQSISRQLHSPQLEYLGVVAAVKGFCRDFAARQNVEIEFNSEDVPQVVPHEVSLCLFRIAQEALHNATKHSRVRHFDVKLRYRENQLHLTVSDRGVGFDAETALNKEGLGLTSMRERVRLLNGAISIESKPTAGTTIRVNVPLPPENDSHRAAV